MELALDTLFINLISKKVSKIVTMIGLLAMNYLPREAIQFGNGYTLLLFEYCNEKMNESRVNTPTNSIRYSYHHFIYLFFDPNGEL